MLAQVPHSPASAAAECDRLAASPYDAGAAAPGVEGDSMDHARAISVCEAALAQHPDSPRFAFQLGRAYGAATRNDDAVRLYRLAAEKGYPPAMNNLGYRYFEGRGVPKDKAEAVRWFRRAAEMGDARSMDDLGSALADGIGVAKHDAEAVRWFRRGADKGFAGVYNGPINGEFGPELMRAMETLRERAAASR